MPKPSPCSALAPRGHLENERCDQLAMAALRQPNLPVDDGYENKPETEGVRPDMQEGEPCGKCGTPVVKREGKRKQNREVFPNTLRFLEEG